MKRQWRGDELVKETGREGAMKGDKESIKAICITNGAMEIA